MASSKKAGLPVLFTVKETAEKLRCSTTTVYRLVDQGDLRVLRLGKGKDPKAIRIREESIAAYLKHLEQEALSEYLKRRDAAS